MGEAWFTGVADELARCLVDAQHSAEICESFLESLRQSGDVELQRRAVDALVGPAAVARVLMDLIDHPPELVMAAARLCRDSAREAARQLEELRRPDADTVVAALRTNAESCGRLLDATSASS
jgi:hypothetical protein